VLAVAATVSAEPDPGPFHKIAVIRLREDPGNQIDQSLKTSVLRRLEQAQEWGADCIVLDIESYGGLVTASIETADEIFAIGRTIHTVAYVGRKAISGAAMISISCNEIVLSETATIGDSQVIYMTTEGVQVAPEKFQTTVVATFKKYAEGNGYPVPIAQSMVRQEMEVTRYKKPNDPLDASKGFTWVYYRTDTVDGGPSRREIEELALAEPEVVVREGELPTFTSKDAVEYGIASHVESTLGAYLDSVKAPDAEVRTLEWSWAERTSRFLIDMRAWLFLVGAGALYFALKMPGTGVPEALALICFGLFFGASYVANLAGALEVILFLVGVLLIIVEIFVLPGFGVPGFLGLGCMLAGIGLAAIPDNGTLPASPGYFLLPMARDFLLGTIAGLFLVFLIARNLPRLPYFNRLALAGPGPQARTFTAPERPHELVDATGVAESTLRPAGRARIDGKRYDVVAQGAWVEAGTPIRVVSVRGNVINVRRADEQTEA
jgi:membrane-bound serine protease (ClpP class)